VQPLYLRAEGGRIPELKRVIVAHEGRVAMEESLDAGLARLFGASGRAPAAREPDVAADVPAQRPDTATAALVRQAVELYDRARAAQRNDDWTAYGTAMRQLGDVLRRLGGGRTP
jgi:uncharacterized protein